VTLLTRTGPDSQEWNGSRVRAYGLSVLRGIVLVDFPLQVAERARQHRESLLREFAIIAHGGGDAADVPKRLLDIARLYDERYARLNPEADDAVDAGIASGHTSIDLTVQAPEPIKHDTLALVPLLVEVDDYSRSGDLLTPPPDDDIRAFWFWFFAEIVRQLAGEPPRPWRDFSLPEDLDDPDAVLARARRFASQTPHDPAGW
jgi:hypothetical protein